MLFYSCKHIDKLTKDINRLNVTREEREKRRAHEIALQEAKEKAEVARKQRLEVEMEKQARDATEREKERRHQKEMEESRREEAEQINN